MLCYQKKNPQISRVRNSTTDWPACTSIMVFWCQKKGQLVPNMGKHREKQESGTVPPQEFGTVPPRGAKKKASEVALFLTIRWVCF